jgi:hypothetical protein
VLNRLLRFNQILRIVGERLTSTAAGTLVPEEWHETPLRFIEIRMLVV